MCLAAGLSYVLDVKDNLRILTSYLVVELGTNLAIKHKLFSSHIQSIALAK